VGEKSRPEGWVMNACIGWCKHKGRDFCRCFNKSEFVDCRDDCLNFPNACDICERASEYETNR